MPAAARRITIPNMLKSVEIERFRGIREGRVEGLAPVTIFVGPNGSGKSTLLEAIFCGAGVVGGNNFYAWSSNKFQSRNGGLFAIRHNEGSFPSEDVFYGKRSEEGASIGLVLEPSERLTLVFEDKPRPRQMRWKSEVSPDAADFFVRAKLLDFNVLFDAHTEDLLWDELLNRRLDRELKEVMNRVYGLDIESFSYTRGGRGLKVLFGDRDFALRIDDLAGGMRLAFRAFAATLLARDSAVLIEEFDGYQHAEAMPRFAEAMLELASRAGAQLFLATHSLESVRAFVSVKGFEDRVKVVQTDLAPDGSLKTAALGADVVENLIEAGVDVRSTR